MSEAIIKGYLQAARALLEGMDKDASGFWGEFSSLVLSRLAKEAEKVIVIVAEKLATAPNVQRWVRSFGA